MLSAETPLPELERLARHLESCPHCAETVERLMHADTLGEAVRSQDSAEKPEEDVIQNLIRHLRRLVASGSGVSAGATVEATQEVYDFLSPSQGPGELGRLGPYRVLRVLGAGGMGVVFQAEDTRLRRMVALKAMRPVLAAKSASRQRFLREAQATAAIEHDHIVAVFQADEDRGVPYLAMPLLRGETLEARLQREGKLSIPEVLRIGREVAEGLAAAHERGLIHRDVKPANVWLETRGDKRLACPPGPEPTSEPLVATEGGRVKIVDFGLARAVADESQLTQQGMIVGTPAYMAPEQTGGREADGRCDLFSLGCVLYRACTGQLPFQGRDTIAIIAAVALHQPKPPGELNPEVPEALSDLVMRLLAKEPADRPQSASEVAAELAAIERDGGKKSEPARRRPRRRWLVPAMAAALLLAVLGPLAYWFAPMVIRVATNKGELVIAINDPDVEVTVKQGGVVVEQKSTKRAFVLTAGDGEIEVFEKDGVQLATKKFTLVRGGTTAVSVTLDELADARKKPTGGDKKPGVATLDRLDPAKIPASERFPWQPKELVAVLGEHRGRHWGVVRGMAYSPDGKFVASAGEGGVILWDPQTLRQRAFLPGGAWAVAFSPDSRTLAVVAGADTVRLWDVGGGEPKERVVIRPGEVVLSLAFSPDGKTLAGGCRSAGGTTPVRLWEVTAEKPKEKAVLKGHTGAFNAPVAFSPDGKTLASGGDDKTVRLWDLTAAEPKETAVLPADGQVGALAFSPDGKTLATGGFPPLRLWDVTGAKPKEKAAVRGNFGSFSLAFTPDSKTLACNLPGGGPGLLDLTGPEPKVRAVLKGTQDERLALSADGKSLVTTDGPTLRLWDLTGDEPKERLEPQGQTAAMATVAFTPDGTKLATGGGDGIARLWDLTGPAPREWDVLQEHGYVSSIAFAPDGKMLAIGGGDVLYLWNVTGTDLQERAVVKRWQGPHRLAFSPDGKTLLCTSLVGNQWGIQLLDVTEAEPRERALLKVGKFVPGLALAPDGKTLACHGLADRTDVVLWDLTGAEPKERAVLKAPPGHYSASALAWSPDGKTLAGSFANYGGPAATILLWDLSGAAPREQCRLEGSLSIVPVATSLVFTHDGKTLVHAGSGGEVIFWDVVGHRNPQRQPGRDYKDGSGNTVLWDEVGRRHHTQRRWQRLPGAVLNLAFAPDGRHLITANSNGTAYVLRLDAPPAPSADPKPAFSLDGLDVAKIPASERFSWQPKELVAVLGEHRGRHWGRVLGMAYSPDGKFAATAGDAGTVLWDPQTLHQRALLPGGANEPAFAPDGKTLAVAMHDASIRLWDLSRGEPKERAVIRPTEGVLRIAFSPDGKTLAGCGGKTVRLWDVTAEKPTERAVLKWPADAVTCLAFAPDGKTLAAAGGPDQKPGEVRLWDVSAAEPKDKAVFKVDLTPRQLVFSPDGKTLAEAIGTGGGARLWDLTGAAPKQKAVFAGIGFGTVAFSPDGNTLARSSHETAGGLHLIDLTGVEPRERATLRSAGESHVAFAPDGKSLVTADQFTGVLRLWDLTGDEPKERLEPEGHVGPLAGAVLAPDGKILATHSSNSTLVRLWDLTGAVPRVRAELRHQGWLFGLTFAPDGKTLASCENGGTVRLWDLTMAEPEERIKFQPGAGLQAVAVTFSPDGKTLACYCADGNAQTVRLWDVSRAEPKERAVLPNSYGPFAFAPHGKTLACNRPDKDGSYYPLLWDLSGVNPKEQPVLEPSTAGLHTNGASMPLAWAADGKTLAGRWWRGTEWFVVLWDMSGAQPKEQTLLPQGTGDAACPASLAFAPDGQTVAVLSVAGEVILWDVANHKKPKQVRSWRLPGAVLSVAITPDGRHLITGNANGTAYVLRLTDEKSPEPKP